MSILKVFAMSNEQQEKRGRGREKRNLLLVFD